MTLSKLLLETRLEMLMKEVKESEAEVFSISVSLGVEKSVCKDLQDSIVDLNGQLSEARDAIRAMSNLLARR
jgi:hypothetical protein